MTAPVGSSEQISGSSAPISIAVTERVAAMRLGLSVDTLRRDRRLGHLGIPYVKYGEGKRGRVRYDTADLDRFLETKKRRALPPVAAPQPPVQEAHVEQPKPPAVQPEPPIEPTAPEPYITEPPVPRRRSPPRTMWEALAERVQAEPEDEPFAVAGRAAPRRKPGGYFGG